MAGEAYVFLDCIRRILGCITSNTKSEELKVLSCLGEEHYLTPRLASVLACVDIQRHTDEATPSLSTTGDLGARPRKVTRRGLTGKVSCHSGEGPSGGQLSQYIPA